MEARSLSAGRGRDHPSSTGIFRALGGSAGTSTGDAACWHTLDPETRLITSDTGDELISAGIFTPATIGDAGAKVIASESRS